MRALNLHKARWRQLTVSLFAVYFSLAEKYGFSESSSSIFRLVTRKESDFLFSFFGTVSQSRPKIMAIVPASSVQVLDVSIVHASQGQL